MGPKEAAEYLGITPNMLGKYEREQGLPTHRLGNGPKAQRRFYISELDAWLRSRCSDRAPRQATQ